MECACTVDIDICDERVELLSSNIHKARKEHKCHECHRKINPKEEYVKEVFISGGDFTTHKTCEDCYSLRQVFFSSGWFYGQLWEDFIEMVNDYGGDISVSCILQLTKPAKDEVLDIIEKYWEGCDAYN
jgi:hypothetical protein